MLKFLICLGTNATSHYMLWKFVILTFILKKIRCSIEVLLFFLGLLLFVWKLYIWFWKLMMFWILYYGKRMILSHKIIFIHVNYFSSSLKNEYWLPFFTHSKSLQQKQKFLTEWWYVFLRDWVRIYLMYLGSLLISSCFMCLPE